MAELIWKNKHLSQQTAFQDSDITTRYRLVTVEQYPQPDTEHTAQDTSPSSDTWYNRLILGDNRIILPLLLRNYASAIDLIYIDPPFMTGRTFTTGSQIAYHDTWKNDVDIYLQWLYEICSSLHTLLADDGSLYIHLDWRVAHYAKIILDELFGLSANGHGPGFKNEIIWHYQSGGRSQKHYARKHDTLFLYTKSGHSCFHPERIGERRGTQKRNHMRKQVGEDGRISWTIRSAGRLYTYDEDTLITPSDVWSDIQHLHQKDPERNGYATQKPEALLERIILASSDEHDLVLDCFCGSGVTPSVATRLKRRWIACDQSEVALNMTRKRILAHTADHMHMCPFMLQHFLEA